MFLKNIALSFLFIFALPAFAQLTPEQQAAKEKGIILFNQYKVADAELRVAAEAGDKDAQYYLAEYLRKKNRYMSAESIKWYQAAAEQGEPYSMIRLGTVDIDICTILKTCEDSKTYAESWLLKLLAIAKPKAEKEDPEGLYLMYQLTLNDEYLKKSAIAGYGLSQYKLALFIKGGQYEKFRSDESRQRRFEELMQASSENGYPKAMNYQRDFFAEKGDFESARYWFEKGAATGYADTILGYGIALALEPEKYRFKRDIVKGHALLSLLTKLDGGGGANTFALRRLPTIESQMTPEQLAASKRYAAEWEATHPPLSYFPDKLSDF